VGSYRKSSQRLSRREVKSKFERGSFESGL